MPSKVKKPISEQAKLHVRSGDTVVVLSGDARGKQGTVIKVFPKELRALVDGDAALFDTKHVKADPQQQKEGGRIRRLRKIHVSKLALLDPTSGKAAPRLKHVKQADGSVARVARKSGHAFIPTR
jgi:large subunit ribosomal protein L24